MGVLKKCTNWPSLCDKGWHFTSPKQHFEVIRLYCKLITLNNSRIASKVSEWLTNVTGSWEIYTVRFVSRLDMGDVMNEHQANKSILRAVKLKIKLKAWLNNLYNDRNTKIMDISSVLIVNTNLHLMLPAI